MNLGASDTGSINTSPTTVTPVTISTDPCYNYTVLDNPWRSINNTLNSSSSSSYKCDQSVSWSGWYRLFINGMSAHIPDTCVAEYSCGTWTALWIRGGHPTVTDGVVTRELCGNDESFCCSYRSYPIKVKACPGDYYVYELVRPAVPISAYCADTGSINTSSTTVTPVTISTGKDRFFISSEWLSWSGSRQFCRYRGADLVIINTEEKQRYITSLAKERVWIGLTDIETEGTMKWVDNSTLTQGFWYKREPNNAGGDEDCVELTPSDSIQNWNDLPCFKKRKAICEK
ncbi:pancreatic secretory granule membrane major glycoprotein GP2-like [Pimephales promelas]|nr:pancreatic secretory granule membrane major glycoprotein GP2-like [Pimephales promelas]